MSTILVSILSQHSLPNYLFIKEMEGNYDELLFISTVRTDKDNRDRQLEKALGLNEDNVVSILVNHANYQQTLRDLEANWEARTGDRYIVNLTGGTKAMALAVERFFSRFDSRFYYVPINDNVYYNLSTGEASPISTRVGLAQYLELYGIRFQSTPEAQFAHTKQEIYSLYNEVKSRRFYLPKKLKPSTYTQEQSLAPYTAEQRRFYSGGWFEQFAYFKLKDDFRLRDEDIACSLKIYRHSHSKQNDNELDVAFTYKNQLYVVECKVSLSGNPGRTISDNVEEYLYKLAAVSKDFGLQVKSYLFTLYRMSALTDDRINGLSHRCSILGICGIVSGNMFSDLKSALNNTQQLLP